MYSMNVSKMVGIVKGIPIPEAVQKEAFRYIITGSRIVSPHKMSMKPGTTISINKKRHLFRRQIEFNIRGIILTLILYLLATTGLPILIGKISNGISETWGITNSMNMCLVPYFIGMYLVLFILTVLLCMYQAWSFKIGLFGFDVYDKKEMFKHYWMVEAVTILGCLASFIYTYTQNHKMSVIIIFVMIIIVLIDMLVKIYLTPKYNIYSFKTGNGVNIDGYIDIKNDIKIQLKNDDIETIDLTARLFKIHNNDDIITVGKKGDCDIETYKKEDIMYVWIGNDRLEYKDGTWHKVE